MKKNNKGFTLIELLVVVAIIGILAAVGTVAYNGYTTSAKINASKSNQASVTKYIAAELQKCNLEEATAMNKKLDCNTTGGLTPALVITAAVTSLGDFKNSHKALCPGVTNGTAAPTAFDGTTVCAAGGLGYTSLKASTVVGETDFIIIETVVDKASNTLSNKVQVE